MGQTVVFKVSLDADDVAIDEFEPRPPRPPRHDLRDAGLAALRDRHWQLAALLCLVVPAAVAAVTFAVTRGAWVGTALLVAAAVMTPTCAAWAGAARAQGERRLRAARWAVTGASGALLALASVPGVALAAAREGWAESQAVPTLAVLALSGAAGAWLGLALANRQPAWPRIAAAALTLAMVFVPFAVATALLPETVVTEQITYHSFVATSVGGRPAFICRDETIDATRRHTEDVAWIAMTSPVAWVVDAASFSPSALAGAPDGSLAQAQAWTRSTRVGPDGFVGYCYQATSLGTPTAVTAERYEKAGTIGARLATAAAALCGAIALFAVSRRKSA
jgi:hypothetical protein